MGIIQNKVKKNYKMFKFYLIISMIMWYAKCE